MKTDPREIKISQYTYDLPEDRIAKFPLDKRDESKLLVYRDGQIYHRIFKQLPQELSKTLLVVNNTKVVYARLIFHKVTGAKIEIFCLNPVNPAEYNRSFQVHGNAVWACMIGNLRKWKEGELTKEFQFNGKQYTLKAQYIGPRPEDNTHLVCFEWDEELTFSDVLEAVGLVPIPPYLNREARADDKVHYQTVYSRLEGSVAAPTAGLHFTPEVIDRLKKSGADWAEVTLHVGAGTFRPVKTETIGEHPMHTEYFTVEKEQLKVIRQNLGNITAVGTTTMRTLESLYWLGLSMMNNEQDRFVSQWVPYERATDSTTEQVFDFLLDWLERGGKQRIEGWTQIIIVPGYEFRVVDNLITNFHQPQSTLLLLVAAFVGEDWRRIYDYALHNDFRFLSYGDSSLLFGKKSI